MPRLTTRDHRRDSTGMTYVYAVVSRRAGGVSIGINLNPNNACNWRCIYCQVPGLTRGGPPPLDMERLAGELQTLLEQVCHGDFLQREAPPEAQRLVDVAFSGNGEPTSAQEFSAVVTRVAAELDEFPTAGVPMRLITNGSLLGRADVQRGIAALGRRHGGEVWFKIDAVGQEATRRVNGVALAPGTVLRRLRTCARLCPTWVQTCLFLLDDLPPQEADIAAYVALLRQARDDLAGIHLYGLARPSMRVEAPRLRPLTAEALAALGTRIELETGLTVRVSP